MISLLLSLLITSFTVQTPIKLNSRVNITTIIKLYSGFSLVVMKGEYVQHAGKLNYNVVDVDIDNGLGILSK